LHGPANLAFSQFVEFLSIAPGTTEVWLKHHISPIGQKLDFHIEIHIVSHVIGTTMRQNDERQFLRIPAFWDRHISRYFGTIPGRIALIGGYCHNLRVNLVLHSGKPLHLLRCRLIQIEASRILRRGGKDDHFALVVRGGADPDLLIRQGPVEHFLLSGEIVVEPVNTVARIRIIGSPKRTTIFRQCKSGQFAIVTTKDFLANFAGLEIEFIKGKTSGFCVGEHISFVRAGNYVEAFK